MLRHLGRYKESFPSTTIFLSSSRLECRAEILIIYPLLLAIIAGVQRFCCLHCTSHFGVLDTFFSRGGAQSASEGNFKTQSLREDDSKFICFNLITKKG